MSVRKKVHLLYTPLTHLPGEDGERRGVFEGVWEVPSSKDVHSSVSHLTMSVTLLPVLSSGQVADAGGNSLRRLYQGQVLTVSF